MGMIARTRCGFLTSVSIQGVSQGKRPFGNDIKTFWAYRSQGTLPDEYEVRGIEIYKAAGIGSAKLRLASNLTPKNQIFFSIVRVVRRRRETG